MIQSRDARSRQVLSDVAEETGAESLDAVCREAVAAFQSWRKPAATAGP